MSKYYYCEVCGNLLETINDSGINPVCCNQEMEILKPASTDGAHEKHVPVCSTNKNELTVTVGEHAHPMEAEHFIEWITVCTNSGHYRKTLCPGDSPTATFHLSDGEHPKKVYAYCNIHGLWESK